jgi:hypothetical protein
MLPEIADEADLAGRPQVSDQLAGRATLPPPSAMVPGSVASAGASVSSAIFRQRRFSGNRSESRFIRQRSQICDIQLK